MAADVQNSWWGKIKAWWNHWWLLIVPVAVAIVAMVAYSVTFHDWPTNEVPEAWGSFGDFLGGLLNPVVSTLTLVVAFRVWHLQREAIAIQKTELAETKAELKNQADTAEANRREQRFFDLMQVYQQTLDGYQEFRDNYHRIGKPAIHYWVLGDGSHYSGMDKIVKSTQWDLRSRILSDTDQQSYQTWKQSTKDTKLVRPQDYAHYFRVVYRILCDAESLLNEDRHRFIRIFRDQLSSSELFLLGLNLWASPEGQKMQVIASEYSLLKHLPAGDFRNLLEQELPRDVFGRKFAAAQMM